MINPTRHELGPGVSSSAFKKKYCLCDSGSAELNTSAPSQLRSLAPVGGVNISERACESILTQTGGDKPIRRHLKEEKMRCEYK